jgi:dUTP pyrophosphatase
MPKRVGDRTRKLNEGKIICLFCSRTLKFSGRANPNCQYKNLNDNFFEVVDSSDKAYILGWIASDGHLDTGSISIFIQQEDIECIEHIRDMICPEIPISYRREDNHTLMVGLTLSSQKMVKDVCGWLRILPGEKASTVDFPDLASNEFKWSFLRGLFDGDGSLNTTQPKNGWPSPVASISSYSDSMRSKIKELSPSANNYPNNGVIEWNGVNALDFLGKLYANTTNTNRLRRKYELFENWCLCVPGLNGPIVNRKSAHFIWARSRKDAVPPSKANISDSGYDLTLLEKVKSAGNIDFYDTGVKIQPLHGWYFDLVPRSSISKSGYMLANSVGVIDRSYIGSILVPLIKTNTNAEDLKLPNKLVQIIPRPIIHAEIVEVEQLETTSRAEGSFGSTNNK